MDAYIAYDLCIRGLHNINLFLLSYCTCVSLQGYIFFICCMYLVRDGVGFADDWNSSALGILNEIKLEHETMMEPCMDVSYDQYTACPCAGVKPFAIREGNIIIVFKFEV